MSQTITPWEILTSDEQFLDREKSDECTPTVRANAADLAERCSKLFDAIGHIPAVSSGFRTSSANAKAGGASRSAHCTGEACDFRDPDGYLGRAILGRLDLLEQFDLYLENPHYTPTWVHLQSRKTASGKRVFNP